jgi:hypothetical protein
MSNIDQHRSFALPHAGQITDPPKATIGDREFGNAPAERQTDDRDAWLVLRLIDVAAHRKPRALRPWAGRSGRQLHGFPFGAVTYQNNGCFDPFPLLSRLGHVLQPDLTKQPRLRRILSML